jgi:hypothetical protein
LIDIPDFTEIAGHGPRDPRAMPSDGRGGGRLRARVEWVAALFVVGSFYPVFLVLGLRSGEALSDPFMFLWWCVAIGWSAFCLAFGAWYATRSVVVWDEGTLVFRHRPWRKPVQVAAGDVVWRPGATYVGRLLSATTADGKRVSFPLWLLRRSGARRLFAFLDAAVPASR